MTTQQDRTSSLGMLQEFKAASTPLNHGFTVIEASAGTGKTTTICAIVLRLLLEGEGIPIEQILVTTYTELATAELRGRIRAVVSAALECVRGGSASLPYVAEIVRNASNVAQLEHRLELARQNLDQAPIFTIHGFCARVLADRAFESGVLFDAELTADQSSFLNEVADDFWRIHVYPDEPLVAALVRDQITPAKLVALLTELTNNPTMRVLPPAQDLTAVRGKIAATWKAVCRCWSKSEQEIRAHFSDLHWAVREHHKPETVAARFAAVVECIGRSRHSGEVFSCIEFFAATALQANTRARRMTPQHAFFERCDELHKLTSELVLSLQSTFCEWAREELRRRKTERRVQSFDDMLTQLDQALCGERGADLCQNLRERFPAALIDEFQDTDPVQYSIFSQIYRGADARVFLIGDPKQAIYGFRGADVFTYLHAAEKGRRYTLGENWRSEAKLVNGVTEIFSQRDNPFVIERIDLAPVRAAGGIDAEPLMVQGQRDRPLRLWIVPGEERDNVARAVAAEIARLLSGTATIGGRKVVPRDIAVLVTMNWQPAAIREALAHFRIPSVVYSTVSVLDSREARELLRLLEAVAHPVRVSNVRSALATEIFGRSAAELDELACNEASGDETLNRFAEYCARWRDAGFIEMMRDLLIREKLRGELLRLRDGERRLTNLLHLTELLHSACAQNRFGMDGLIAWLRRQIYSRHPMQEEYELRLETDDDAVRIVTVHKSKGLEFGVTFCPFARKEPRAAKKEPYIKFHDGDELVLDLAREQEHISHFEREQLAENVRQLYVALTRAKHRSYCVWQERSSASHAALAWLLSSGAPLERFIARGEQGIGVAAQSAFQQSDCIAIESLPVDEAPIFLPQQTTGAPLSARTFRGVIDRSWAITSFSGLISGRVREPETPDYDSTETAAVTEPATAAEGIHVFPGGTRAGTCLHKILEELDFANGAQLAGLVQEKLAQFHISGFDDVIVETISRVLEIPLGESGLTLGQLSARLPELEFTFPISGVTPGRLQSLFADNRAEIPAAIDRLQFDPVNGFMKGFIDLVFEHDGRFYFADWKSNWLGPDASFYTPENLSAAMAENFYTLQLSIYALALHRFLKQRLRDYEYDQNFGGAFYVFLRGVDSASRGVFAWRPPHTFVQKLDRILHGNV